VYQSARSPEASVISSRQAPESLVQRIRALADKRQKEAAKEGKVVAFNLMGAAKGYRAIAEALERQPSLPWMRGAGTADKKPGTLDEGAAQPPAAE
jgi:hypothetical protein